MTELINMIKFREPVCYSLDIISYWEDKIECSFRGISETPTERTKLALIADLESIIQIIKDNL